MTERISNIADRFLDRKDCSSHELALLKNWLFNPSTYSEVESWLSAHWTTSNEIDSDTLIETVFLQIQEYEEEHQPKSGFSIKRILRVYQKVAAFLLIPIIGFGMIYWVSNSIQSNDGMTETIAPRGQKSQIILNDGTKVWLNSDTKIKYPGNFSKNQRDVYLEGEAFFEVSKNPHQPFVVHTSVMNVKVLGTKFNVKAYSDEDNVETSLFEGKISLLMSNPWSKETAVKEVNPGQSLLYSRNNRELTYNRFPQEEISGWKKNQLIFRDDTFSNLVRKVERWYDVKVLYDEKKFSDRRLTVELYEGERLELLLNIISLALSVDYKYEKGEIRLTPKANNM